MPYRVAPIVLLLSASTFLAARSLTPPPTPSPLVVHEWGTFTSVAGEDGSAVQWVPRQPPGELPCFVEQPLQIKGFLPATVRMETPVLYFYAPSAMTVDVKVRFPKGVVTEWYPHASVPAPDPMAYTRSPDFAGTVSWSGLTVSPDAPNDFLTEPGRSHYYQARATDAAPVRIGTQTEKFLFYRGVGLFPPPITARLTAGGRVAIKTTDNTAIGDVVLFVNNGGRIGYRIHNAPAAELTLDPPVLEDEAAFPGQELERLLVGHGLYAKEAAAMVNTWRDSWFEEGTRLFYLVPQATVDRILPLDIRPAPKSIARAFVGRMEIVTPAAMTSLETALTAGDLGAARTYGRFLQPIADRILARKSEPRRGAIQRRLDQALAALNSAPPLCK